MRLATAAVVVTALPAVLAGCGSSGSNPTEKGASTGSSGHKTVAVKITDAGCEPPKLTLSPGATTFEVTNDGATKVSEFEVLDGDLILGEAENIAPGLSGRFSLTLSPGTYVTYCPGGTSSERGSLVVTGTSSAGAGSAAAAAAVAKYRRYVEDQTSELEVLTASFAEAVRSGDVAAAKRRYAAARAPYERIEPVAESFGALDPRIDAREGDVPAKSWTGFHPLEKALWQTGKLEGTAALANQLVEDVRLLHRRSKTMRLQAAQIANGAVELLGEVSKSKITGEEERYSHIDLLDMAANVAGAKAAYVAVRPIVERRNPTLAKTIDARFTAMDRELDGFRDASEPSGYVIYTTLTDAQIRGLSRKVDALAEPLSQVGAIVVSSS